MLPFRPALAAAAAALLLAACSSSDGPEAAASGTAANSAPSPGPAAGETADASQPPETPASTKPASSPTARATSALRPQAEPVGSVRPPRSGTYRYAQSGTSIFGEIPAEGTLTIQPAEGRRQQQTRTVSPNETLTQSLLFHDDGIDLLAASQRYGSDPVAQTYECRFEPALRVIRLPLTQDAAWRATSSCEDLEVDYRARVLGSDTLTIGGRAVEVVVVRATLKIEGDGARQATTSTSWLSPQHRLIVRSEQQTEGRQGGVDYHTRLTEELLDLDPQ